MMQPIKGYVLIYSPGHSFEGDVVEYGGRYIPLYKVKREAEEDSKAVMKGDAVVKSVLLLSAGEPGHGEGIEN